MQKSSLSEGRTFSLKAPVRKAVLEGNSIAVYGLYFEGGQSLMPESGEATYQVLEGDAEFTDAKGSERARKGQVVVGNITRIENLGGGLLVMLETRTK